MSDYVYTGLYPYIGTFYCRRITINFDIRPYYDHDMRPKKPLPESLGCVKRNLSASLDAKKTDGQIAFIQKLSYVARYRISSVWFTKKTKIKKMETNDDENIFNRISDDVLLKICKYLPKKYWHNVRNVCTRFKNICYDKEMFR